MKLATLFLALLPLAAACSDKAFTPFDWKEEIQLHDGRTVIAERVDTYGGARELAQSEPNTKERTIKFADPSNPSKTYAHKITGTSNYLMLDFHEGKPWLVVFVGPFSADTKCPIGTYDTYSWDGVQWVQRSFKDKPKVFTEPNMTDNYLSDQVTNGTPDLRRKGKTLSNQDIALLKKQTAHRDFTDPAIRFAEIRGNGRSSDCQDFAPK